MEQKTSNLQLLVEQDDGKTLPGLYLVPSGIWGQSGICQASPIGPGASFEKAHPGSIDNGASGRRMDNSGLSVSVQH